jgi:hypothetical protein
MDCKVAGIVSAHIISKKGLKGNRTKQFRTQHSELQWFSTFSALQTGKTAMDFLKTDNPVSPFSVQTIVYKSDFY